MKTMEYSIGRCNDRLIAKVLESLTIYYNLYIRSHILRHVNQDFRENQTCLHVDTLQYKSHLTSLTRAFFIQLDCSKG
jgi:hypothetical protein